VGLDGLVERLLPRGRQLYHEFGSREDQFKQIVTEPIKKIREGAVSKPKGGEAKEAEVVVLASGNLGLIYFKLHPGRATLEWINENYPDVISGLSSHEGIGFVMVRTAQNGSVVIGARGIYHLLDDKVEGENPLLKFGSRAAEQIRRTDGFNNVPDILVMSLYDVEKNEVAAFEELIGSHGGLGGDQTKAFIFYPSEWNLGKEEVVGAEKVYKLFKKVMENTWASEQR
jgi:putative membrane protein